MKTIIYLSIVCALLCGEVFCTFNPTRKAKLDPGVQQMQYSLDQKILAVSYNSSLNIYDGVTTEHLHTYNFPQNQNFASLSFSQDQSAFAVGYKNEQGATSYQIFNITNQNYLYTQYIKLSQYSLKSISGQVNGICFTADNSHLVIGTESGDIVVIKSKQQFHAIKFGDSLPISSISCSPQRTLQFVVAGGKQGQQKKLSTYTFNVETLQIKQQFNFDINQNQTIADVRYSSAGNQIYYCGSSNVIYIVGVDTHDVRTITAPTGLDKFIKVRMTNKQDIVAVCTIDTLYTTKPSKSQKLSEEQVMPITAPTFSLSQHGSNIIYVVSGDFAQVAGQCDEGQFLDDVTDTCLLCDKSCILCLDAPTTCFQCVQAHYVSQQYMCLSCVANCKSCKTGTSCQICYDPFIKTAQSLCGCQKGKYVNNKQCTTCPEGCLDCINQKQCSECADDYEKNSEGVCEYQGGLPTWAVILLIIIGVAVVLVISGIVFIKMRKGQKRSPLLTDSDQGQKIENK